MNRYRQPTVFLRCALRIKACAGRLDRYRQPMIFLRCALRIAVCWERLDRYRQPMIFLRCSLRIKVVSGGGGDRYRQEGGGRHAGFTLEI